MKITRFLILLYCLYLSINNVYSQDNHTECSNAQYVCNKSPLYISRLSEVSHLEKISGSTCFDADFKATNAVWLTWQVSKPGDLSFTILPIVDSDDIDFVLYRLQKLDDCEDKILVRCMAAGPILGEDVLQKSLCSGVTGLRSEANINEHGSGCADNADNFLRPVEVESGEYYALFINNFRSPHGIHIEWGGSATFQEVPGHCSQEVEDPGVFVGVEGSTVKLSLPFPNPSTQTVQIQTECNTEQIGQMSIVSSEGYIEKTQPFSLPAGQGSLEINTSSLRPGVYFINLKTKKNVYSLRFVKH